MTAAEIVAQALIEQNQPNGVIVQEVGGDDPWMRRPGTDRSAMAARTPEGEEWILSNRDAPKPEEQENRIRHEVAHLLAWRQHGEKIKEHGTEFQRLCRQLVTERPSYYCKKD
jgi:hypothetical protein